MAEGGTEEWFLGFFSINLAHVEFDQKIILAFLNRARWTKYKYHCGDNHESKLFSWLHFYYINLASVRIEYSVTTYSYSVIHLWPLILCSLFSFLSTPWFLLPAISNQTSHAQVCQVPEGKNLEGTLFWWLYLHYAHLAFVGFEHAVCFATGFTMQNLGHIVTIEFSANK